MADNTKVLHGTDADIKDLIKEGVSIVDFWAPWCMPCRMQGPILEQLADNIGDKAKIIKLDVDDNPATAGEYGIVSIPSIYLFKNGEVVERFVGVQSEDVLKSAIDKAL